MQSLFSYALDSGYEELDTFKAVCYLKGIYFEQNIPLGKGFLQASADRRNRHALLYIANFLQNGEYFDKDEKKATHYYKEATTKDFSGKAFYEYANCLFNGIGTKKDMELAIVYYLASAKVSYLPAFLKVAKFYYQDDRQPKCYAEIFKWLTVGAKANVGEAQYMLGRWYITGEYVEKDVDYGIQLVCAAVLNDYIPAAKDILLYNEQENIFIDKEFLNKATELLKQNK